MKTYLYEHSFFPTKLQQSDNLDRGNAFKQQLRMLISYLTDLTAGWRTDDSQATRYFRGRSLPSEEETNLLTDPFLKSKISEITSA